MALLDYKTATVFRIKPFVPLAVLIAGLLGAAFLTACSGQNANTASARSYKEMSASVIKPYG